MSFCLRFTIKAFINMLKITGDDTMIWCYDTIMSCPNYSWLWCEPGCYDLSSLCCFRHKSVISSCSSAAPTTEMCSPHVLDEPNVTAAAPEESEDQNSSVSVPGRECHGKIYCPHPHPNPHNLICTPSPFNLDTCPHPHAFPNYFWFKVVNGKSKFTN